jgi:hypothetical protein
VCGVLRLPSCLPAFLSHAVQCKLCRFVVSSRKLDDLSMCEASKCGFWHSASQEAGLGSQEKPVAQLLKACWLTTRLCACRLRRADAASAGPGRRVTTQGVAVLAAGRQRCRLHPGETLIRCSRDPAVTSLGAAAGVAPDLPCVQHTPVRRHLQTLHHEALWCTACGAGGGRQLAQQQHALHPAARLPGNALRHRRRARRAKRCVLVDVCLVWVGWVHGGCGSREVVG